MGNEEKLRSRHLTCYSQIGHQQKHPYKTFE